MPRARTTASLLALAAVTGACATAPAPPAAPLDVGAAASVVHEPTSAADLTSASAGAALRVVARFALLERLPTALRPLAAEARLVVRERDAEPLAACPRLLAGGRAGEVPDPARFVLGLEGAPAGRVARATGDLRAALPTGVAARFELAREAPGDRRRVAVSVARIEDDALDVTVTLERPEAGVPAVERLVLERRAGAPLGLVLLLPSPFDGAAAALAVALQVEPPPAPGEPGAAAHGVAFAACAGDLARARAVDAARSLPTAPAPASAFARARLPLDGAFEALAEPDARRRALLGLASATGSPLGVAVALGGDDALLEAVAARLLAARPADPAGSLEVAGWATERACALALADAAGVDPCPPRVHALLVRRAGAVGLHPGGVVAAVEGARDLATWEERLAAENRALLRDGDPSVRARALAWLAARGRAPAGFDPLAPRDDREALLDAWLAARGPSPAPEAP